MTVISTRQELIEEIDRHDDPGRRAARREYETRLTEGWTKPYLPELAAGAAKELDRVAAEVARGLHGEISTTCSRCPKARRDVLARGYEIRYGDLLQEITFVLVDKREYQLTCRRKQRGDASACAQLRSSFRLA